MRLDNVGRAFWRRRDLSSILKLKYVGWKKEKQLMEWEKDERDGQ